MYRHAHDVTFAGAPQTGQRRLLDFAPLGSTQSRAESRSSVLWFHGEAYNYRFWTRAFVEMMQASVCPFRIDAHTINACAGVCRKAQYFSHPRTSTSPTVVATSARYRSTPPPSETRKMRQKRSGGCHPGAIASCGRVGRCGAVCKSLALRKTSK